METNPKALLVPLNEVIERIKWDANLITYAEIEGDLTRAYRFMVEYQKLLKELDKKEQEKK